MATNDDTSQIPVWDPFIRVAHWLLVAAFFIAYFSGEENEEPSELHEWAGYVVGAIVVWRIFWGVFGPRHARFREFLVGPRNALIYLIDLMAGRSQRYLGHSPAGGAMIVLLLACLGGIVITGLIAEESFESPTATRSAVVAADQALAGEGGPAILSRVAGANREKESLTGELHGVLANITLALVILHFLGVVLASYVHRENLVAAMITGKKRR